MICLFMSCHLLGMSSACINPILYGYLHDNFKAQFIEIFSFCCCGKKCAELPSEAARRRSHCPVQVTKAEQKSKQQRRRQRQQLRQPATAEETMAMVAVGADARAEDSCSRMSELKDESKVISEMQTKLKQTEMWLLNNGQRKWQTNTQQATGTNLIQKLEPGSC